MKKNTYSVLAALAFAGSALFSQAAFAAPVDISSTPGAVNLAAGGSLTFGDKFKNNQKSNFFNDLFTFNVAQASDLSVVLNVAQQQRGEWPEPDGFRLVQQRRQYLAAGRRSVVDRH